MLGGKAFQWSTGLLTYFPHISNGISGEFPGRVLSLSGASAPVVNLHVHISFSLAFPDKP
jgi:hypothetical protein